MSRNRVSTAGRNRVSTAGLTNQWKQRRPRKRQDDDDLDAIIDSFTGTEQPNEPVNVFSNRPDEDGIIQRTSKRRKTKQSASHPSTSRSQEAARPIIDDNQWIHDQHDTRQENDVDLKELMDEILSSGEFEEVSEWTSRRKQAEENWESSRPVIFACVMDSYSVPDESTLFICFKCKENTATIRCIDCMGSYMCSRCDNDVHVLQPLHNRQTWANGSFERLPQEHYFPNNPHYTSAGCRFCQKKSFESVDDGKYIAITLSGRFEVPKRKTICSECKKPQITFDVINLLHNGFWPGSPTLQTSYIFEQKLLELWLSVSMHLPGSSLSGFLNSLGDISAKYGRKSYIDHTIFSRAAAEFAYMQDELLLVKHQDLMKCPSCTLGQAMCHVDGNHKVYRYQHVDNAIYVLRVHDTEQPRISHNMCSTLVWIGNAE